MRTLTLAAVLALLAGAAVAQPSTTFYNERGQSFLKLFRSHFAPPSDDGDEGVGSAFSCGSHPWLRANATWHLASFSEMPPKNDARSVFQPILQSVLHAMESQALYKPGIKGPV
jgi:hypothetical protein